MNRIFLLKVSFNFPSFDLFSIFTDPLYSKIKEHNTTNKITETAALEVAIVHPKQVSIFFSYFFSLF